MKKLLFLALLLVGCGSQIKRTDTVTNVGQGRVTIHLVNQSSMPANELLQMAEACNQQLQNEFKQNWAIDAVVSVSNPANNERVVYIKQDFSEFSEAVRNYAWGFHRTGEVGYVNYSASAPDYLVALVTSHEVLEMLTNPNADKAGYECADPCHQAVAGYTRNGMLVTDFAYPSFYVPGGLPPYDHTGNLHRPLQPMSGSVLFASTPAFMKYKLKQLLR